MDDYVSHLLGEVKGRLRELIKEKIGQLDSKVIALTLGDDHVHLFVVVRTKKRLGILRLSKIEDIPIRLHRKISGGIKQVIVKRYNSGKWFACFCIERYPPIRTITIGNAVGVDMGINHGASTGRNTGKRHH